MRARSLLVTISFVASIPAVALSSDPARALTPLDISGDIPGVRTTHVSPAGPVRAGAASIDSTWHLGSAAGQYATRPAVNTDPTLHATTRANAYGLQGREFARALVIEGSDGARMAVVANDLYIPQDLLNRRVASILAEHDRLAALGLNAGPVTGIDERNMMISVSHSHSSPYQTTPSWGVWTFEDVFDLRQYEDRAQKMAQAVIAAVANLQPARIGAAVGPFSMTRRHSFGPTIANTPETAGTPAGYPQTDGDLTVTVVRVDTPAGAPLATWVSYGLHPESLDGYNILTGEYVNTMYRFVDREVGGVTLFSQNDTGTAEPARDGNSQPPSARAEFSHRGYAQMERNARLLATAVKAIRADVTEPVPSLATSRLAMEGSLEVGYADARLAPPGVRPTGAVSNCRTEKYFNGTASVPLGGLPDCVDAGPGPAAFNSLPPELRPSTTYEQLRAAGVPIPDNISAYSITGLEETATVHLQAFRLGGIAITVCPCEQWADQSRNIKSRLDLMADNLFNGFDWTKITRADGSPFCQQNSDTSWTCANPQAWRWNTAFTAHEWGWSAAQLLAPISDAKYRRMVAQINNDAAGWDAPENLAYQETEPSDISKIRGNFTHEELTQYGYPFVMTTGMSNDYYGYITTYREFQRGDHYRKALTGLGPHSMDWLATRLTRMAASLNGRAPVEVTPKDLAYAPEDARMRATAEALGELAEAALPAYEATLPNDGGTARITAQPAPIVKRFDAAFVSWVGGSNYTDTPDLRVERKVGGTWVPFANGQGEVQYRVDFPAATSLPAWRAGAFEWLYRGTFETQNSDIPLTDALGNDVGQTPVGTYRFVVDGKRREAPLGAVTSYRLVSNEFDVAPWDGVTVSDLRVESDGRVSFVVGPTGSAPAIDYPDSYTGSPFPSNVVNTTRTTHAGEQFCLNCAFRPRADRSSVADASVTVDDGNGGTATLAATLGAGGRFFAASPITSGECARVDPGGVVDTFGEKNATASATVCRA